MSFNTGQQNIRQKEKTMNQELLRIVENIARDKNIDKESIFVDLEEAMVSAARKHFGEPDSNIVVSIDRGTGEITAYKDDVQIDIKQLGRIPAQTAKQVIIQKIRADERNSIYCQPGPLDRRFYAERRTDNGPDSSGRRKSSMFDS